MIEKINFKNYGNQKNWISGNYTNPVSRKTIAVISPAFRLKFKFLRLNFDLLEYLKLIFEKVMFLTG